MLIQYFDREQGKVVTVSHENPLPSSGGGGGGDVKWPVPGTPTVFPPAPHNHDERYYTKTEIDQAGFLLAQPDGETVEVQGGELRAKTLTGLQHGVMQLNTWLAGTEGNIQLQVNAILEAMAAFGRPLRWLADVETHADMMSITTMQDSDFVIVLNDETRDNDRTWYAYHGDLGTWRYMGSLSLTNRFVSLLDTPNAYDNGKLLRSGINGLYFDTPKWSEIDGRPNRTKAAIEQAVDKAHTHAKSDAEISSAVELAHPHPNIAALNRIGIDGQGRITVDGVTSQKEFLYARRSSGMDHDLNYTLRFDKKISGNIPIDENGAFTLTAGKTYMIMLNIVVDYNGWIQVAMVDTSTGSVPPEAPNGAILRSHNASVNEIANGVLSLIITPTTTRDFGFRFLSNGSGSGTMRLRGGYSGFTIAEI